MQWRNEQIYHLRQTNPLTKDEQDAYFQREVSKLFEQDQPSQILFSYLIKDKCIGYGGLVHINWTDKHAEISFVMDTSLEREFFEFHWTKYLSLIEQVAFDELNLHKIFTYAFDLRPRLYSALSSREFNKEATLKDHALFNGKFIDVLIHAKLNEEKILRIVGSEDLEITFKWATDKAVRAFAYSQEAISEDQHVSWFRNKVASVDTEYYILEVNNKAAGSIRFDIEEEYGSAKISYLIDPKFTGKGYGTYLLEKGVIKLKNTRPYVKSVFGHVLKENLASIKIFKKLGYEISFESNTELKFEKRLK